MDRKVASSTQNQAFNSLLFFYRHVLNREFGEMDGVVRAKRKPYIPIVLSLEEIEDILNDLDPPYNPRFPLRSHDNDPPSRRPFGSFSDCIPA